MVKFKLYSKSLATSHTEPCVGCSHYKHCQVTVDECLRYSVWENSGTDIAALVRTPMTKLSLPLKKLMRTVSFCSSILIFPKEFLRGELQS